jgi:D-alanyl-D-alanine dipeptidase
MFILDRRPWAFLFIFLPAIVSRIPLAAQDQDSNFRKYGLKTVATLAEYHALVARDPRQELVRLDSFIPGIRLDIRYATDNNIMGRPVYQTAEAFLRRSAAEALKAIQKDLNEMGYGLKIFDGYRPYDVTVAFYERYHDTAFVASPYTGSRHNRGCAVDMTIIDWKTGKELDMPTAYDNFTKMASYNYPDLPAGVLRNRAMMQKVMLAHGFLIYPDEWWHFDFGGWKEYPVMNIPFEDLGQ